MPKFWSKLPQQLLKKNKTDNWQSLTKSCQHFLTGKALSKKLKGTKGTRKHKQNLVTAPTNTTSGGSKVLNNELNGKLDFNALAKGLKSLGVNFNKSLCTLLKKAHTASC